MVFHHFHQGDEAVLCVGDVRVRVKVALASASGESLVVTSRAIPAPLGVHRPTTHQTLLLMWQGERWVAVLPEQRICLEPKPPRERRHA